MKGTLNMSVNEPIAMTDAVTMVLTPQDKQMLELLANHDDRSMSSVVRQLIRQEATRRGFQAVNVTVIESNS